MATGLHGSGRGVSALPASLDTHGMPLTIPARSGVQECVSERR